MDMIQRMVEMGKGFAYVVEKVVSVMGYCRIQLTMETLPVTLKLIKAMKEYQCTWTKQIATVVEIAASGERVMRLGEHVRGHLSSSGQWEKMCGLLYPHPARRFPLELKGEPKKTMGIPVEALLRMLVG